MGIFATCQALVLVVLLHAFPGVRVGAAQPLIWDTYFSVYGAKYPSVEDSKLSGATLKRALLWPANTTGRFLPTVYQPAGSQNHTLRMQDCRVTTLCDIVKDYALFLKINSPASIVGTDYSTWLIVSNYTAPSITISNTTYECTEDVTSSFSGANVSSTGSSDFERALRAAATLSVEMDSNLYLNGSVKTPGSKWMPEIVIAKNLMISGEQRPAPTVIDWSMGLSLFAMKNTPIIQQSSAIVDLRNVYLTNLCTYAYNVTPTLSVYSSYSFMAVERGRITRTLLATNVTFIVNRVEMESLTYWWALYPSPFEKLNSYAEPFKNIWPDAQTIAMNPNSDALVLDQWRGVSGIYTNVTLWAADSPPAVLKPYLPGPLLPPTDCFKQTPIPLDQLNNKALAPIHSFTEDDELEDVINAIVKDMNAYDMAPASAWYLPPMLMQFTGVDLTPLTNPTKTPTFNRDMLWVGPISTSVNTYGNPTTAVMDHANRTTAMILAGRNVGFYLQRITIVNPPMASELQLNLGFRTAVTSLPLWAFSYNRDTIRVIMDSVTIRLPLEDYSAVYALASIGGVHNLGSAREQNPQLTALQNAALDFISIFELKSYSANEVYLNKYVGWGVNGTRLLFVPAGNFTPPPRPPASSDSSDSNTSKIIVGCVVGGVGLLAMIAAVVGYWYYKKSKPSGKEGMQMQIHSKDSSDVEGSSPHITAAAAPSMLNDSASIGAADAASSKQVSGGTTGVEAITSSSSTWDPMKEVQQIAGTVPGSEGEKLILMEPIGKGGFGTVYKGKWRNLDVAVKTVLFTEKHTGKHDAPQQRAVMEAAVSSSVVHPNVVCTYHCDIKAVRTVPSSGSIRIDDEQPTDWKLYLVQELCHASLADALVSCFLHDKDTQRPHLNLLLGVLGDVARGMVYIHSKNIIHGDLKPENVLLKHDPSSPIGMVAKITDFGLCTTIDPTQSHISGFNNGTPFYSAPEIATTGQATKTSDVYSFGVLMVEMYRGMPPWIKTAKGYRPNKQFNQFPPDSPRPYLMLARQCLDKNFKSRPPFEQILAQVQAMYQCLLDGWMELEAPASLAQKATASAAVSALAAADTSCSDPATVSATVTAAVSGKDSAKEATPARAAINSTCSWYPVDRTTLTSIAGSRAALAASGGRGARAAQQAGLFDDDSSDGAQSETPQGP
eukprot:CAMPEP_0202891888 /NCGR_PEP_ID=MMETSP1392-20130828/1814_1 /ASSEMBLY_ACC=CAM_ASM_000868 /TAXON_ID=225041 /ORGANISM="Chlamydomonas chlamydogama, Strain SAG 11-48b" /LENGTH=1173 /DNA_ID=CAMNT_0049575753 /DNA_START=288 /DNA_END=3809 /DNA_ORIENTATION=+